MHQDNTQLRKAPHPLDGFQIIIQILIASQQRGPVGANTDIADARYAKVDLDLRHTFQRAHSTSGGLASSLRWSNRAVEDPNRACGVMYTYLPAYVHIKTNC